MQDANTLAALLRMKDCIEYCPNNVKKMPKALARSIELPRVSKARMRAEESPAPGKLKIPGDLEAVVRLP